MSFAVADLFAFEQCACPTQEFTQFPLLTSPLSVEGSFLASQLNCGELDVDGVPLNSGVPVAQNFSMAGVTIPESFFQTQVWGVAVLVEKTEDFGEDVEFDRTSLLKLVGNETGEVETEFFFTGEHSNEVPIIGLDLPSSIDVRSVSFSGTNTHVHVFGEFTDRSFICRTDSIDKDAISCSFSGFFEDTFDQDVDVVLLDNADDAVVPVTLKAVAFLQGTFQGGDDFDAFMTETINQAFNDLPFVPPAVQNGSFSILEDETAELDLNLLLLQSPSGTEFDFFAADVDGLSGSFGASTERGKLVYTPGRNFNGIEQFSFNYGIFTDRVCTKTLDVTLDVAAVADTVPVEGLDLEVELGGAVNVFTDVKVATNADVDDSTLVGGVFEVLEAEGSFFPLVDGNCSEEVADLFAMTDGGLVSFCYIGPARFANGELSEVTFTVDLDEGLVTTNGSLILRDVNFEAGEDDDAAAVLPIVGAVVGSVLVVGVIAAVVVIARRNSDGGGGVGDGLMDSFKLLGT